MKKPLIVNAVSRLLAALAYRMQAADRHAQARAMLRDRAGLSPIRKGI